MQSFFFHRATGSAALASTLEVTGKTISISEVRLHLSTAGANENFTITLNHGAGAVYDAVLNASTTNALTDLNIIPTRPWIVESGVAVDFALANSNTATWGLEVIFNLLG